MRLKNLNLFEKYIEKAVLALGGLYALVVLWFFVIGSPYAIELKALHAEYKPGEIEEAILKEANDLDRRISTSESPFEVLQVPPYTDEFRGRLTRPLIPVDQFATYFGRPGLVDNLGGKGKVVIPPFFVPQPKEPTALIWDTGFGVLAEPNDPAMVSKFEQLIGDQKPRDFRWVSVSAQFDLKNFRTQLEAKQDPNQYQQIPKTWWRDRLIITDVVLQRQLQNPETGEWGEIQTLPAVPGNDSFDFLNNTQLSFRTERANWAPPEAERALEIAAIEEKRLARPLFPELIEGLWLPPDANDQNLPPAMAEQVRDLVKRIKETQKQIKDLKQRIADGTGPITAAPTSTPGTQPDGTQPVVLDLPTLEARRLNLREELYILLGIVEPIEVNTDTLNTNRRTGILNRNPRTISDTRDEDEYATPDTIRVWQHDVSVKDGQSVRYRIMIKVLNPLFFRDQVPNEQREEFYGKLTLTSAASAWTEPVQVLSEHHFFLSGASKNTQTATVEVYCIFNGQWQRREFDVKPGDPIGQVVQFQLDGETKNVNMNVGGVVVDIDYDAPSAESPNQRTTRLIYFDGRTNTLQTRTLEEDQANPKRDELRRNLKPGS
ncbi:MAG: hypothetical protein CMJ19_06690 [Phycisphaeraceae bacterium]|nr:hypothetical protein [Phycisphaeraceae bacterium]